MTTIFEEVNKRLGISRFLVPHESSLWFAKSTLLGVLTTSAVFGAISWIHQRRLIDALIKNGVVENTEILERYAQVTLWNSGVVMLAASIFITLLACFLLHRIAGPIYRIRQHMLSVINDEEVGELRLRSKDRLMDVCETYNQLLYKMELIDPKNDS